MKLQKILPFSVIAGLMVYAELQAQDITVDSVRKEINLKEITIDGENSPVCRLKDTEGVYLNIGKKNDVIQVQATGADLSVNNARQVMSRVAGIHVWENDASGIQINVSIRGLSPNRSWEFNVRQNGYDIAAEIFGYPEAYYQPPLEAVSKITIIRGSSALQYGPQFGGLLNYQIKKPNPEKNIEIESQQTYGSYNLFNSYNAVGGTVGNFSWYGFLHHRTGDGWRDNSRFRTTTGYLALSCKIHPKLDIGAEYTRMDYLSQQAGGLSDSLLNVNPQKSLRSRNWFQVPWNVFSLNTNYTLNQHTRINLKVFGTLAERNSVGFLKPITVADTFNATLQSYNLRQVDRDFYKNYGTELRFLQNYQFVNANHYLSAGVRAYSGFTQRKQSGIGSGNSDFDLNIYKFQNGQEWGKNFELSTRNYAFFVENAFQLGKRIRIVPGIRYEIIQSGVEGYINTSANGTVSLNRERRILLTGLGGEIKVHSSSQVYFNYSQAYRPVLFSDLIPPSTQAVIDPNLKDASGYNIDAGYRGTWKNILSFDIGGFYLFYDNRIGTIQKDNVVYRTNIGSSVSKGTEIYVEINPIKIFTQHSGLGYVSLFASYAHIDAVYTRWDNPAIINDPVKNIKGKKLEYAPEYIARYGFTYRYRSFSLTAQVHQTSDVFTDAANTEKPSADGTIGRLKGYTLADISVNWNYKEKYIFKSGVNNLTDEKYATRRASGYPGPGLLPGTGRTWYFTLGVKI